MLLLYERIKKIILSLILLNLYLFLHSHTKDFEPSFEKFTLTLSFIMFLSGVGSFFTKRKVQRSIKFEIWSRSLIVIIGITSLFEGRYYYQSILIIVLGIVFLIDLLFMANLKKQL
ncbi:MAG: hypothetical protein CME60_12440 [Halobacteriovoraceae bacterium]|nr:hypothetical protein [Halobacteriovoraceae bacterium]